MLQSYQQNAGYRTGSNERIPEERNQLDYDRRSPGAWEGRQTGQHVQRYSGSISAITTGFWHIIATTT